MGGIGEGPSTRIHRLGKELPGTGSHPDFHQLLYGFQIIRHARKQGAEHGVGTQAELVRLLERCDALLDGGSVWLPSFARLSSGRRWEAEPGWIGETNGVLARECAHVGRVIGVGANVVSSCGQRDSDPCRHRHGGHLWRSGCASLVAVMQAAHFGQLHYLAHARRVDGSRLRRVLAQ